jgi:YD repeat-containing protein
VDYVYDLVGKIQQVSDPTGTYGFAYDNMGRLIGTTTHYSFLAPTFSNAYTYHAEMRETATCAEIVAVDFPQREGPYCGRSLALAL